MTLLDTHIGFVEALRSAGLSVSLAEGLDAISALEKVHWHDRETVRAAYAATLVKRRCLFLHLDYPDAEREREIVTSQVPGLDDKVAAQLVDVVVRLRELELKKAPSIAESVDWARTLIALQVGDLDERVVARTLGVVLKHASDQQRAVKELKLAVP